MTKRESDRPIASRKAPAGAAIAASCAVILLSYVEYLAWALTGRDNEWMPILQASLAAALLAAATAALAGLFVRRSAAVALGLWVPLAPFVYHGFVVVGLQGTAWFVAAGCVAVIPAAVVGRLTSLPGITALLFVGGGLALGGAWAHHVASVPPPPPVVDSSLPDVVLVVLDTTRRDRLSVYGHESTKPTTPALEEFAKNAEVYEDAWSVCGWTPPSHASLFTGLLPAEHGVTVPMRTDQEPFPPERQTLARVLAAAGYRTAGYVANHILLSKGWGVDFQEYRSADFGHNHSMVPPLNALLRGFTKEERLEQRTKYIFERARTWWTRNTDAPRFLFLNLLDPHWPYIPQKEDESYVADLERPAVPPQESPELTRRRAEYGPRPFHVNPGLTDEERAYLEGLYAGEIAGMDREVGRFFDWLEAEGSYDDTIIIVTSDHGERLGERGLVGHAVVADPYVLRVPLIVRYPQSVGAARIERRVQIDGIPGYVLHLAGIEGPEVMAKNALHKQDRKVIIAQQEYAEVFLQSVLEVAPDFDTTPHLGDWCYLADDRFLYAYSVRESGEPRATLSDYLNDPDLTQDVSRQFPQIAEEFRAMAEALPRYSEAGQGKAEDETWEILRSLGYVR